MPRAGWLALVLVATGFASPAVAQPLAPISPLGPDSGPVRASPVAPARDPGRPPPILGAPVGVPDPGPQPARPVQGVAPAAFAGPPQRGAAFGAPSAAGVEAAPPARSAPVPTATLDAAVARTAYQPPPIDPLNDLLTKRSELRERDQPLESGPPPKSSTARAPEEAPDRLGTIFGSNTGALFRSDHIFDSFISPVTNPFLFEDPRSLTEVRPIFIFQKVPGSQGDFHGGNVTFFGTQARLALSDRWSFVINKFGGIAVNTNAPSPFHDATGFAEIWLGPKWTFYRGDETGTLGAAGLQFQLPVGSKGTFQHTGTLSLVPYASFAQSFLRDFQYGSFNVMANTGLSFSSNKERSDYYWLSGHLDFDVGNAHRFYPLFELNWFLYTANGTTTPIGAEGRDLINFGGHPKGSGLLTGAFGARGKISESAQIGAAFEFPWAGQRDLFRYRFTIDFILRY
jgi:hypothetical protein